MCRSSTAKTENRFRSEKCKVSNLVGWHRRMHVGWERSLSDHSVWCQTVRRRVEAAEETQHSQNIRGRISEPASRGQPPITVQVLFVFRQGWDCFQSVCAYHSLTHSVKQQGHMQASFLPGKIRHRIQNQWGHVNIRAARPAKRAKL